MFGKFTGAKMSNLLGQVASYYDDKLRSHGETPQGVDWNGEDSQKLRFSQISRVLDSARDISVNDLGCGYGAYADFLAATHPKKVQYNGYDISEEMIASAQNRLSHRSDVHLSCTSKPDRKADFTVASGIFNVRMDRADDEWLSYIENTLDVMFESSTAGFAFNCLTSYSDADKMRDYLYYASPTALFDHCKRRYSRNVALLHDYELYEFTLLVRI